MLTARKLLAAGVARPAGKIGEQLSVVFEVCLAQALGVVSAADIGIDVSGAIDFASFGRIEEDTITAAHHGLVVAERPEGEAKAGSKDILRGVIGVAPIGIFVIAAIAGDALLSSVWSANSNPPRGLEGSRQSMRSLVSLGTLRKSQRSPRFKVRREFTFQSS